VDDVKDSEGARRVLSYNMDAPEAIADAADYFGKV
jgi:hypothetical protein